MRSPGSGLVLLWFAGSFWAILALSGALSFQFFEGLSAEAFCCSIVESPSNGAMDSVVFDSGGVEEAAEEFAEEVLGCVRSIGLTCVVGASMLFFGPVFGFLPGRFFGLLLTRRAGPVPHVGRSLAQTECMRSGRLYVVLQNLEGRLTLSPVSAYFPEFTLLCILKLGRNWYFASTLLSLWSVFLRSDLAFLTVVAFVGCVSGI